MHQLSHQSHHDSDTALLFGQSQRENNELGDSVTYLTYFLILNCAGTMRGTTFYVLI